MIRLPHGLVAVVMLGLVVNAVAVDVTITVAGRGQALGVTPIEVVVPESVAPGAYTLRDADGATVPASVFAMDGKHHLAAVLPEVAASGTRTFTLTSAGANPTAVAIHANEAGGLDVDVAGQPFTRLVVGPSKPYLYPLFGPTGQAFTRAYPMEDVEGEKRDHPHQRSFWFTHGDVNGHDYWASDPLNKPNPKFGQIRQTDLEVLASNGSVGVIRTRNDWVAPDGTIDCRDVRTYRLWGARSPRILDVELTVTAGDKPATFGDTKEGMFGLRIPTSMDVETKKGGQITNAAGLRDAAAWGKPSPWVDYTGPIGDKTVGIAILNRPDSFRYPTHWHVRTYGLFAANPFGYTDFKAGRPGQHTITPGESIRFAYRVLLHEGDTADAGVTRAFAAYATPPKVTVSAAK